MVEDGVDFIKKKHFLPRPTGVFVREGGSVNVGARSKSLLNVAERHVGLDNIEGNMIVKTRFVILGLRARDNLYQPPLAISNIDQQTFLTPSTSVRKPRSDVKITSCILVMVDQLLVHPYDGLMLKWCIQYKLLKFQKGVDLLG
ncbi:hypothetical protein Tco_1031811 [Tanacetum coccineum]|uniref:Uncharacterized protein n=1 Tax=Tanacetum coccineum TaxID=301880 RepID=A0ABQ5GBJ2_9ASTR